MAETLSLFLWTSAALFNLLLAYLVYSARPLTMAHRLVTVVLVANALPLVGFVLSDLASIDDRHVLEISRTFDLVSVIALFAIPLVFPRHLLGPRGQVFLWGTAVVLLGAAVFYTVQTYLLWAAIDYANERSMWGSARFDPITFLTRIPFRAAHILGILVFLGLYLGAANPLRRRQAQFFLAAYVLSAATWVVPYITRPSLLHLEERLVLAGLLLFPVLAVPIAIMSSRFRGARREVPGSQDLFVVGAAALGLLLGLLTPSVIEWGALTPWLLRPLLFAYGLLQFQLLDSELRARLPLMFGTQMAGLATVFAASALLLQGSGVDPVTTTGLAFFLVLIIAFLFAAPMLRLVVSGDPSRRERNLDVYRTALANVQGDDGGQQTLLSSLRATLGVSERDHAVLSSEMAVSHGEPSRVRLGARFLGRYRVETPLGEGGFSRTYLARDERVGRDIVLKAARLPDRRLAELMLREAQATARLRHPNIVTIHDVEEVGDEVVLVLEHMDGGSLADRMEQGPLSGAEAMRLARELLDALAAAHAQGIIHRDMKPANVLFTADGQAKLADFGVARLAEQDLTVGGLSMAGSHPGSLRYMSPEQVRGLPLDARSDLYSLGLVLHEALTGRSWLAGQVDGLDARVAVLRSRPRLPVPGVSKEVNALLRALLQTDREKRPGSATAASERLAVIATRD